MLECCEPLDVVREKGICISKLTCLAQCNGATTKLKYGDMTSLQEFREVRVSTRRLAVSALPRRSRGWAGRLIYLSPTLQDVMRITHQGILQGELLIVGYNRKLLGQTGTGHFSPIGGYHQGKDMALIMDVARFKCTCGPSVLPLPCT